MGPFPLRTLSGSFLLAVVAGLWLVPSAVLIGRRYGFVVSPRLYGRSERTISYLGGPALALTAIGSFFLTSQNRWMVSPVIFGGLAVLVLGFIDDRMSDKNGIHPLGRIVVEVAIAGAVWAIGLQAFETGPSWLDAIVTILFLVASVNAFNLVDNMDGVAGMTAVGAAFGVALLAIVGGQVAIAALAFCVGGAAISFLGFNMIGPRAYLGDSGSLFLGFVIGGLALQLNLGYAPPGNLLAAIVVLAVPFTDTASRQISRLASGGSLFDIRGGTDHISHRLVGIGCSTRHAAWCHGMAGLMASTTAIWAAATDRLAPLIAALTVFSAVGILFALAIPLRRQSLKPRFEVILTGQDSLS
jgi:UDP-GlcNAc:undecaprenyl-phosphate GlcNAc-1-phosphate transferase